MLELPKTHPGVQRMCQNRFHTVLRSDEFCAGLSSDLAIEQNLMQKGKTSSGLSRGGGGLGQGWGHEINELQLSKWLLPTPVTAGMNQNMQEFTCVKYQTSNQQKSFIIVCNCNSEGSPVCEKMFKFLKECNPFDYGTNQSEQW